jgi:hypothetical protein
MFIGTLILVVVVSTGLVLLLRDRGPSSDAASADQEL